MTITFVVYAKAEPQGSSRGFLLKGKWGAKDRVIITSANKKLKPYRQELTELAMVTLSNAGIERPLAGKHTPVSMAMDFYFAKPPSVPKKRRGMVVKPDLDKLIRSSSDALTGILYADDAQIVELTARKHYGTPERVEITVSIVSEVPTDDTQPVLALEG